MNLDQIVKWGTLAGAIVAAISGVLNLWWKAHEKADKIKVFHGLPSPVGAAYVALHVVNKCDNSVQIKDFGFVDHTGMLISVPSEFDNDPSLGIETSSHIEGERLLAKRNDHFVYGVDWNLKNIVGAYAVTMGSDKIELGFKYDIGFIRRSWVRLVVRLNPHWFKMSRTHWWQFWREK